MTYVTILVSLFPTLEFLQSPSEVPLYNLLCLSPPKTEKHLKIVTTFPAPKTGEVNKCIHCAAKNNEGRVGGLEGGKWKGGRKERKDVYTTNLAGVVIARHLE